MTLTDLDLAFDNTALATNATKTLFPSPLSGEGLGVGCGASYLSPNPPLSASGEGPGTAQPSCVRFPGIPAAPDKSFC